MGIITMVTIENEVGTAKPHCGMLEVQDEDQVSHRANLAKMKGFTGLSAFYR